MRLKDHPNWKLFNRAYGSSRVDEALAQLPALMQHMSQYAAAERAYLPGLKGELEFLAGNEEVAFEDFKASLAADTASQLPVLFYAEFLVNHAKDTAQATTLANKIIQACSAPGYVPETEHLNATWFIAKANRILKAVELGCETNAVEDAA